MTPRTRSRRRTIWAPVAALAAVAILLSGCGSSGAVTGLDTAKVERAIAKSSLDQRGLRARVHCPAEVPQVEGLTFSCAALVGSVKTRFVVEQDGSGHVHYEAP